MTLYARGDIQGVALGESGCGKRHRRPLRGDGTPVKVWGINCAPCEAALNDDSQWSSSRYKIPLSPDEEKELEELQAAAEAAEQRARIAEQRERITQRMASERAAGEVPDDEAVVTGADAGDDAGDDEGASEADDIDYSAMTRDELKELARSRGLAVGGPKDLLITRLVEHDQQATGRG